MDRSAGGKLTWKQHAFPPFPPPFLQVMLMKRSVCNLSIICAAFQSFTLFRYFMLPAVCIWEFLSSRSTKRRQNSGLGKCGEQEKFLSKYFPEILKHKVKHLRKISLLRLFDLFFSSFPHLCNRSSTALELWTVLLPSCVTAMRKSQLYFLPWVNSC